MTRFIDAYAVLGVPPTASAQELKAAHRRLVRRHHPDLAPSQQRRVATERMQDINVAYGLVRDADARARYDRLRRAYQRQRPDTQLGVQWEEAMQAAGRWAGRWWGRHRRRLRRAALVAFTRSRRVGVDVLGRVLWLLSVVRWGVTGLVIAVAAQRVLGLSGQLVPLVGVLTGGLVGSHRGWYRRLRLAGIPVVDRAGGLAAGGVALAVALWVEHALR